MWKQLKLWWRAEGDLAQVQGLSDRMLADKGLDRNDLRNQVHGRTDPVPTVRECYRHPLRAVRTE